MSDQSTIESLANKLAAAELTDDEVKLLVSLFADDDVRGFASKPAGYTATDDLWKISPNSSKHWIEVLSTRVARAPGR